MSLKVHSIKVENFKAFREFTLPLEGRHLLVYGDNGAGKSSLYWSLYTFLQSSTKPLNSISKYFEPNGPENLLNRYEQLEATPKLGEITIIVKNSATGIETPYCISEALHETCDEPIVAKANLASDFITYRFIFSFSNFRNSEVFDIWPLFEREILPFCIVRAGQINDNWSAIKSGMPTSTNAQGALRKADYEAFNRKTTEFSVLLGEIIETINQGAQKFYNDNFQVGDPKPLIFRLTLTQSPSATGTSKNTFQFTRPVLKFEVSIDGQAISRPQTFLNEAKLTQLALSIRFAASLANLRESDLKLMVLDDLLVSLDMSNRTKVVKILLEHPELASYQKVILTHDLGFFREFIRSIGPNHDGWNMMRLKGTPATQIECAVEKDNLQKAEDYLNGHCLDEAATCLRKAADEMARRYREWITNTKVPPGQFFSFVEDLRAARNKLSEKLPSQFYERVLKQTPEAHRDFLVPDDDTDIDLLPDLTPEEKGKLKNSRAKLRNLVKVEHWAAMKNIELIDELISVAARVLNPAAHGTAVNLHANEVQHALELINDLKRIVP